MLQPNCTMKPLPTSLKDDRGPMPLRGTTLIPPLETSGARSAITGWPGGF